MALTKSKIEGWSSVKLDDLLGKAKNRVKQVGVELEGGWTARGLMIVRDGSVNVRNELTAEDVHRGIFSEGELGSQPMEPELMPGWMRQFYPKYTNATCGMHLHMSFRSALHYQRLMTPAYPATVVNYISKWAKTEGIETGHPIWARLSNKSRYCQHKFFAEDQACKGDKDYNQDREGHRYTVVNYAYSRFSTVEVRLLPMFKDVEQGIRALTELLSITNAFLALKPTKEPLMEASYVADPNSVREEVRIYV